MGKAFFQRKIDSQVFRYVFATDTVWRLGHQCKRWSRTHPENGVQDQRDRGQAPYIVFAGGGFYRTFAMSESQVASYDFHKNNGWPNRDRPYMDEKGVIPPNRDAEFPRFES